MSAKEVRPHLSPTTLANAQVCPLRLTLRGSSQTETPRKPPVARYGIVAHRVLEQIAGRLMQDDWESRFETCWEQALFEQSKNAEQAGDNQRYGSLREWPRRDLTRLRLQKRLGQLREQLSSLDPHEIETEVWLETHDPPLRGQVDLIVHLQGEKSWLLDLKTGPLSSDEVPAYYRTQILTYGYLQEKRSHFPSRLSLLSLPSGMVDIDCDQPAAVKTVNHAYRTAVRALQDPDGATATPSATACRSCHLLAACPAAPSAAAEWHGESVFVWGRVTEVNGPPHRLRIEMDVEEGNVDEEQIVIHDVDSVLHPDGIDLEPGREAVAVDLVRTSLGADHYATSRWSRLEALAN